MSAIDIPAVVFLGLAERAAHVRDLNTNMLKWNVLGLKSVLLTNFFPLPMSGLYVGLAMRLPDAGTKFAVKIKTEAGEEIGGLDVELSLEQTTGPLTGAGTLLLFEVEQTWHVAFAQLAGSAPIILKEAGRYLVMLQTELGAQEKIGEFHCLLIEPAALTPERIAAIKSNPRAAKLVRAEYACRLCSSKLRLYAGVERNTKLEAEGFTWYQEIPDHFACECGKTQFDLSSLKRNFFVLVGHSEPATSGEISFLPPYEKSAVESLRIELLSLLGQNPPEETIQKFIEQNPILLHQFPAEKLFFKPPILTRFRADFGIVTPQKELILIEIEPAGTRLLKKDGGQAAGLRHAFDQVHSWLHEVAEHRLTVLDSLDIPREMVSTVRGVVIAGRDSGYDPTHLRRLKGIDQGRVLVLTYDDIAAGLAALAHGMGKL